MAENQTINPEPIEDEVEVKQNFVSRFAVKYPRTAKVVAIAGGVTAIGGVLLTANTMKKNKHHLELAADQAKGALSELSSSVSPTDAEA